MTMPYARTDAIEAEGYARKPGIPILSRDKTYAEIWLSEDSTHPIRLSHGAMDEFAGTLVRIINPEGADELEIVWNRDYGEFRYRWGWMGARLSSPMYEKITIGIFIEDITKMLMLYKTDEYTGKKEKGTHLICEVVKYFGNDVAAEDYGIRLYRDLLDYYVNEYPRDKSPQDEDYWYELEREIALAYTEQRDGVAIIKDETYPLPDSDNRPISDQETLLKCCLVWPENFFNINGAGFWPRSTLIDSVSLLFEPGLINDKQHVCEQYDFSERAFLWESKTKLRDPKYRHMIGRPNGKGDPFTISSSRAVVTLSTCRCGKSLLEACTWLQAGLNHPSNVLSQLYETVSDSAEEMANALEVCVSNIVNSEMPFHPKEAEFIAKYMLLSEKTALFLPMSNAERARKHRLGKTIEKIRNVEVYQSDLEPVFKMMGVADWVTDKHNVMYDTRMKHLIADRVKEEVDGLNLTNA